MGKAKTMGALALTALMGMGAAGQMNGTAEARTLDSSARQRNPYRKKWLYRRRMIQMVS